MNSSSDLRQLWLLRHGKAGWGTQNTADVDRTLDQTGNRQTRKLGQWLLEQGLQPDIIASSSALRTRQTCEQINTSLNMPESRIIWEKDLYLAQLSTLLRIADTMLAKHNIVLIVGHNPGLEEFSHYLCDSIIPMAPATFVQIEIDMKNGLEQGTGQLINVTQS